MRRILKKYIIPHEGNDHTPHLLRETGAVSVCAVILIIFSLALGQTFLLKHSDLAAVLSPVLVDLANDDREIKNISTLKINPALEAAAKLKAEDMAAKGYFSHMSPEGLSPWYWFDKAGYTFVYAGENLAVNFTESNDVERAWMDSPGHRSNILNEKFTEIGIATASGIYQGQPAIYVVQMFGKPIPVRAPVATQRIKGQVKSEATSNQMFIALQQVSTTSADIATQTPVAGTTEPTRYASAFERAFSEPRVILVYAYSFIATLILLVMGLIIMGEYRKHHLRHVSYGAGLLAIMAIGVYAFSAYMPHVIVI